MNKMEMKKIEVVAQEVAEFAIQAMFIRGLESESIAPCISCLSLVTLDAFLGCFRDATSSDDDFEASRRQLEGVVVEHAEIIIALIKERWSKKPVASSADTYFVPNHPSLMREVISQLERRFDDVEVEVVSQASDTVGKIAITLPESARNTPSRMTAFSFVVQELVARALSGPGGRTMLDGDAKAPVINNP